MRLKRWLAQRAAGAPIISSKSVLVVYGLFLALACLWVPWKVELRSPDGYYREDYVGYAFVWSKPAPEQIRREVPVLAGRDDAEISRLPLSLRIDGGRLGLELLTLTALSAVAFLLVRGATKPPNPVTPVRPDSDLRATPEDIEQYRRLRDQGSRSKKSAERGTAMAEKDHNDINPSRERLLELQKRVREGNQSQPDQAPVICVMGGGIATGKSTMARKIQQTELPQAVLIDPHEFITKIPEYAALRDKDPNDAWRRVYVEASYIGKLALAKALARRLDIIWDIPSTGSATKETVKWLKSIGYELQAVFVDTSAEVAFQRAIERSKNSNDPLNYGRDPTSPETWFAPPFPEPSDLEEIKSLYSKEIGRAHVNG